MASPFELPDEALLAPLFERFPCRERQIRSLATLLHPRAAPCRNLVVHGTTATGKSSITTALLDALSTPEEAPVLRYACVNAVQCITGRHLLERIVGETAAALHCESVPRRCETMAQLTVDLERMLGDRAGERFVLVLDGVDRQRDAPVTLMPALARLSELIPCLACVFIVTSPPACFLRTTPSPHIAFPPYTKQDFVRILALTPPTPITGTSAQETADLWTRFCAAVHDALTRAASRTLVSFRHSCVALWPRFVAPVVGGGYSVKEFSKLLVAARTHFQDEGLLNPSIVAARKPLAATSVSAASAPARTSSDIANLLPTTARLLLLAAYLASHNAPRHDLTLLSTHHHGPRRRRRGPAGTQSKHRKIARKLLGAHAFVLERMLAVYAAARGEWTDTAGGVGLDADVALALATLASLRLLVKVGQGGDVMDRGGKWRVNVGWEVVRGVGRSIGVEVEEWLVD